MVNTFFSIFFFRTATFIGLNVGDGRANNRVIALAQTGQCQGVGCGAVENEVDVAVRFKGFSQTVGDTLGPVVVAIGWGMPARIRCVKPVRRLGAHTGVVIAGKLLASGGS